MSKMGVDELMTKRGEIEKNNLLVSTVTGLTAGAASNQWKPLVQA
jgi:hypothetical protein